MATVSLNITLSAAQVTRLEDALKDYFNLPGAANAVLVERYRQAVITDWKQIVTLYEQKASAASIASSPIDPT